MQKSKRNNKCKVVPSYFTNRTLNTEKGRDILTETSPYEIPSLLKLLSYTEYSDVKEKQAVHELVHEAVHAKDNFRTRMMKDFKERVYIAQTPDEIRAVIDFYADFYKEIECRPLQTLDYINAYLSNIRNCAMTRQQVGYRRDTTLQLGQSLDDENERCDAIIGEYKQHVANFEQFIEEDHRFALEKAQAAELVRTTLNAKLLEYLPLVDELNLLSGRIFELEDIRNSLKKYGQFLCQISPLSWRRVYDQRYKRTRIVFELDQESYIEQASFDIDTIVKNVVKELKHHTPIPHLYFKEPIQLINHFEHIELQCRKYILHLMSLAGPVDKIRALKREYNEVIKTEEILLIEYVKVIDEKICFMEECTTTLRNLFFIFLHTIYFEIAASMEHLKLRVCIEYVFNEIYGKAELITESLVVPMKTIERTFEEINLKLDFMDLTIVNNAQDECYSEDLKVMRAAFQAARQLKEFRVLEESLKKAFTPPASFQRCNLVKFVKKKPKIKKECIVTTENLTESQKENLELFTTWCPVYAPSTFLAQLKHQSFNLAN